ncbi:MAG: tetratricopeptide repeat protein [Candidatus Thorarchaeota archaeon]
MTGSISKYFPFLSVNTLSYVETVLESSSNYGTFWEQLCIEAAKKESPQDLVNFACMGVGFLNDNIRLQEIVTVHPEAILGQIYKMQMDLLSGERNDWESLFLVTSDFEVLDLEPWIEFHILGLLWWIHLSRSIGTLEEDTTEERMLELIHEEPNLEPFRASVHQLRGYRHRAEGSEKEAIEEYKVALTIAEEYDDQLLAARLHYSLAWGMRNFDMKAALYHAEQAERLSPESTGIKINIHNFRGEFDISIEHYLASVERMDKKRSNPHYGSFAIILSQLYLETDRPEDALEWARMSLDKGFFPGPDPAVHSQHFRVSNALALLGRVEDAEEHLEFAKGEMLRTGADFHVAEVHYSTGLIELTKGNFKDALWSFSQALEIYEKQPRQTRINSCLRKLAETEVAMYDPNLGELETPWLTRFEKTARDLDLPGYLGFALLSKANLKLKQNQLTDAREILEELVDISKRKGTRFLQPLLVKLLDPMKAH